MSHKYRGRSSSRKNLIYGIVSVILVVLLGVLLWMSKVEDDKRSAELQALNKKLYQEEQEKQTALKQQEAEDSFYQKLADGFDANILIVGDSIGEGAGTETDMVVRQNQPT